MCKLTVCRLGSLMMMNDFLGGSEHSEVTAAHVVTVDLLVVVVYIRIVTPW